MSEPPIKPLIRPSSQETRNHAWESLSERLDESLLVVVHDVVRLTPNIVEVIVKAPMKACKFHPGEFFRFQNFESLSPVLDGTRVNQEGIALTGAWVDPEQGLLSMIALEFGVSSRLCSFLKKDDRVVVTGPTGCPSEIGHGENVILCGGGLGNAVLFSIARAMKDAGNKVVYFAGYKKPSDVFHRDKVEEACDQVIWSVLPRRGTSTPSACVRPQATPRDSYDGNLQPGRADTTASAGVISPDLRLARSASEPAAAGPGPQERNQSEAREAS